jgi:hypothetical protein
MVGIAVIKCTIGMIFTFGASPWFDTRGTLNTWIVIGGLSFVFIASTLPMVVYGKPCRRWTAERYNCFLVLRDGL